MKHFQLSPSKQDALDQFQLSLSSKCKAVTDVCTALSTGKFPDPSFDELNLTPRSTDTSLPSIATSTSSGSYRPGKIARKKGQDKLFFIQPMLHPTIVDYTTELPQYVHATALMDQGCWKEAAAMYAIALKLIPKQGQRPVRNTCMEKRAMCFNNIEAEKVHKADEERTFMEQASPMIVGQLRARWLVVHPPAPAPKPIFTLEKLADLQLAHDRIQAREINRPALMWDHKDSVLRTVRDESGLLLQHAQAWLKNDKDVVTAAVCNNGIALKYANAYLKGNKEIALLACQQNGWALQFYAYRGDRDVVVAACRQSSLSIIFANHEFMADEELLQIVNVQDNNNSYRDIVLRALQKDGNSLRFMHPSLLEDIELCQVAVTSPCLSYGGGIGYGTSLRFCTEDMRNNKTLVLAAVAYDGKSLAHASVRLQQDREVLLVALEENGIALQYVGGGRGGILQVEMEGVETVVAVKEVEEVEMVEVDEDPEATLEELEQRKKNKQLQYEHSLAQYNLGTAYYAGIGGLCKSLRKARHWWELAAGCGHPVAQYNLGLMYLNGLGVPSQNYQRAEEWFARAQKNGHAHARAMLVQVEALRKAAEGPRKERERQELAKEQAATAAAAAAAAAVAAAAAAVATSPRRLPALLGVYGVCAHPLRNDLELVLVAIESNPMALEFASAPLRSNVDVCVHACALDGRAIQFVNAIRWTDVLKKRVLDAAVRSVGFQIIFANDLLPDSLILTQEDLESGC